jgi:hypothetical protein
MKETHIGDTHFVYDGRRLTIKGRDRVLPSCIMDRTELPTLYQFIGSLMSLNEERQTFRLGRDALSELSAYAAHAGRRYPVKIRDLSLTGVFMEVPLGLDVDLSKLEEFQIVLEHHGQQQSHRAVVRRQTSTGYGVFFPASMKGEHIDPPAALVRLVMELQRQRLAKLARIGMLHKP